MKKTAIILAAAISMLSAAPAFSQMTQTEKDECMLASQNCANQVDDIHKRIQRLNKEIKKGNKVYTAAELKKLQNKLTETQELLKQMEKPGH